MKGYIVKYPKSGNILGTTGEFYSPLFLGAGGYKTKIYKTPGGAIRKSASLHGTIAEPIDMSGRRKR